VNLLRYSGVVEEYCYKNFTFANDILDAFAGIEAAMEELRATFRPSASLGARRGTNFERTLYYVLSPKS
jgi:hypothetical protein